ncbi:MAG: FAD-dependent oxidoreductase [Lachnospiraceae bacterium]|jgi:2,4-dienoyl-CoA reductase-like NADH-dependent reductase (Old Yellow Enzyme family)/thioredoxin reductase|nr:FAD-dependent oxidoreductase [Lachnospiraceae bacterium]
MKMKIPLMLQPYTLPNGVVLKSHLESAPSGMHFLQGPEPFPNEATILHYAKRAQGGAGIVCISGLAAKKKYNNGHDRTYDLSDGHNHHYLGLLSEAIHAYGSHVLARTDLNQFIDMKYDVSAGIATPFVVGDGSFPRYDCEEAPMDVIMRAAEQFVEMMYVLKRDCGFDGAWLHMAYRHTFLARMLSPLTNHRKDGFSGEAMETRAKFPILLARMIKDRCGKGFIVEGSISGHDPADLPGGNTLDDMSAFAHMAEGAFDILQVKGPYIDESHPTQFHPETPWLYMAEAIKKSSPGVAIMTIGGNFRPQTCEAILAEGKADLLGMARAFISNYDYGELVREGRGEDLVPCLRCNKCHRSSMADPWISVCSVNPLVGLEGVSDRLIAPVGKPKKVAVIGGGPAGMEAALVAAGRGHAVTLYEKQQRLGGQLLITKNVDFKWPLQDLRLYFERQVGKSGIEVVTGREPTPGELDGLGYDALIAAVGGTPAPAPIKGAGLPHVMDAHSAYARVGEIGKRVAIVGGGEIGVETGLYLASLGRSVTVLEMRGQLAEDSTPVHYYKMFRDEWEKNPRFAGICQATVSEITPDGILYTDAGGEAHAIPADTVILATGTRALTEAALKYAGVAPHFYMVGDCQKASNVQKALRSAYLAAQQI